MRQKYADGRALAVILSGLGAVAVVAAPEGFPTSGNGMWYSTPATSWIGGYLPVGNGFLAEMIPGGTAQEITQLNIESLWSGGPFQDSTYNGNNKPASDKDELAQYVQEKRQAIFASPNGTIAGSYAGAGYLVSTLNVTGTVSNYGRWLDLDTALARTSWTQAGSTFLRTSFCSQPARACIEHINSTASTLPSISYAFSSSLESGLPASNVTCLDNSTLQLRGQPADPGIVYEILGRVQTVGPSQVSCTVVPGSSGTSNATLTVTGASEAWFVWAGDTEYDMDAGDASNNFSFKGADPHNTVLASVNTAAPLNATSAFSFLLDQHLTDYTAALGDFSLSLGQTPDLDTPTDQLWDAYATDVGNTYVEWLLFNFGRHLLLGSSRGTLPANLQGKWASDQVNAWSSDANINLQMNYWFAETLGLNVTQPLWNYMEKTWAPRGVSTAQTLYNITSGWITHSEIFGNTGMKLGDAEWSDYTASSVWMMLHVWDHFDFTGDVAWWQAQGWPLLKGVAQFQSALLVPDEHFNDSTLVVVPCNSPEQPPITFGCAHHQQLIWQLFNAVEKGYAASGDTDEAFLDDIRTKRDQIDKGVHIGSWGQLQEWKFDMDQRTDTHRHLSHLIGLYPGYALANFDPTSQQPSNVPGVNYTAADVLNAVEISLIHRGDGTAADGDAGWEKVWRAASWAQLANATEFYHELSYAVERNFGGNLLSRYSPNSLPFQIDANFGYPAALLNGLVQAPDTASFTTPLIVTVLPALPSQWPSGALHGLPALSTALVFVWSDGKPTQGSITATGGGSSRPVQVVYAGKTVASFSTADAGTHPLQF
ncbi:glycoside hydrolase family 95 protein [Amylostereum chailletii]|nr:glycoside hydrolase family 95 protein [Amylostereum chailletii]